jgi:MFS family permease
MSAHPVHRDDNQWRGGICLSYRYHRARKPVCIRFCSGSIFFPNLIRSRVFSITSGLMLIGLALGPVLGNFVLRTTGSPLSIFYVAACIHSISAVAVWFILPESTSVAQRRHSAVKYHSELNIAWRHRIASVWGVFGYLTRLLAILFPLSIFSPHVLVQEGRSRSNQPKDWNLTLLVVTFAFAVSVTV